MGTGRYCVSEDQALVVDGGNLAAPHIPTSLGITVLLGCQVVQDFLHPLLGKGILRTASTIMPVKEGSSSQVGTTLIMHCGCGRTETKKIATSMRTGN